MPRRGSGFPIFRFVTLLFALMAVIAVMYTLRQIANVDEIPPNPPAATTPQPQAKEEADVVRAPVADDPLEDATPDKPPVDFPEPQDDMQRQFIEHLRNTVTFVYDGDTVMTADGRRVRYIGVDTPERGEPFFEEATTFNKRLVEMKPVRLETCKKRPTDQHGRTLAHVWAEGGSVEEGLLAFGLAEVFHDPDCVPDCRPGWKLLLSAFQKKRGMFKDAPNEPIPAVIADRLIGSYGLVVGVVDNVRESTKAYHVNFGGDWTTDFSVTIDKDDIEAFLRDKLRPHALVGMEVTVFGKVVASYGPRIFAVCPTQLLTVNAP